MNPPVATMHVSLDAPIATADGMESARALTGQGLRDVLAERVAQIDQHGFTLDHDLQHAPGDLALGAASYLNTAIDQLHGKHHDPQEEPDTWPWQREAWRPGDARANLVKGIAIALAVLDRIDHAPRDSGDDDPVTEADLTAPCHADVLLAVANAPHLTTRIAA